MIRPLRLAFPNQIRTIANLIPPSAPEPDPEFPSDYVAEFFKGLDQAVTPRSVSLPSTIADHRNVLTRSVLPRLLEQGGARMLNTLASPRGPILLQQVLDWVNRQVDPRHGPCPFDAQAIAIHPVRLGRYPGVILELPPPGAEGGVDGVALVLEVDLDAQPPPTQEQVEQAPTLYATLEVSPAFAQKSPAERFVWLKGGERLELAADPDSGPNWCRLAKTVADWLRETR